MNINEMLNEIIFKYHLDRCYPHYRNMYEAEKIIRNIISEIVDCNKKVVFVGDDKMEIAFIRNISRDYADIHFLSYKRNDTELHPLDKVDWDQYEEIYLISFYGAEHVERWFRMRHVQYEWIYDVFEREGLFLQKEFFILGKENMLTLIDPKKKQILSSTYTGSVQCELYCQQSKYNSAQDCRTKRIALEKCLFLSLYMKNFIAAKEYAMLLMKDDEQYRHMWNEVEDLLCQIENRISNRKDDIVLYWLDAISYGGESDMPYLQSVMKESVVFENAFTNIAYTSPTLRAMFLGKRDIDDRGYSISNITLENSPVLRFLKEQGYAVKAISGHFSFNFQGQSSQTAVDWMLPASVQYWDVLCGMLSHEQKTLWIAHTLDAHFPFLNQWINDKNYMNKGELHKLAKKALDEQLAFYDKMICGGATRIYMSDHGRDAIYKYHVLFNIYHKSLQPRKIEGLFSYLDFGAVLKQLLIEGNINEKEFEREYVEIGNMDCYNYDNIKQVLTNQEALSLSCFGHKGIIDKEYIYIYYSTGKEWLQRRDDKMLCDPLLFYNFEGDICEPEMLPKYRKLTGKYPKEMIQDEKLKYSRYLHVLYNNIMKHNNMDKRVDVINRILEHYPDSSVAIRMGGITSAMLYYVLSKENKGKLWGFIDNNDQCLCSRLGLPIISSEQIEGIGEKGIKAILLPSYTYLSMLREEAKAWVAEFDILDIYECFDRNGIECGSEFYKVSGTEEDYNVGFPVAI